MNQITTHILDTTKGKPAPQVKVVLYQATARDQTNQTDQTWQLLGEGETNADGRVADFIQDPSLQANLPAGMYKLRFDTMDYFKRVKQASFYPFIEVVFQIEGDGRHYHVPLLLNPFGYSTYRGS